MKAFSIYSKPEIDLRLLLTKLQNYGTINCDFETFTKLYRAWHQKTFPDTPISTSSVGFRDDWFRDFVNYLANQEVGL